MVAAFQCFVLFLQQRLLGKLKSITYNNHSSKNISEHFLVERLWRTLFTMENIIKRSRISFCPRNQSVHHSLYRKLLNLIHLSTSPIRMTFIDYHLHRSKSILLPNISLPEQTLVIISVGVEETVRFLLALVVAWSRRSCTGPLRDLRGSCSC